MFRVIKKKKSSFGDSLYPEMEILREENQGSHSVYRMFPFFIGREGKTEGGGRSEEKKKELVTSDALEGNLMAGRQFFPSLYIFSYILNLES